MWNRHRAFVVCLMLAAAAGGGRLLAGQQGQGQTPSPFPLSNPIRERGSSVTGAYEGWYRNKDGSVSLLVGYFNRNTKQELDIPVGPNNHIDPGGPDQGQPTHFLTSRQWGVFTIKVPKDFGTKKLAWTLVANGQTNIITLHTKPEWVLEPFEDPASKNTPPVIKFQPNGPSLTGPPSGIAATFATTVSGALSLTAWVMDEPPKLNVANAQLTVSGATAAGAGRGRGAAGAGRGAAGAEGAPPGPPPVRVGWSLFRGAGPVRFDPVSPMVNRADGKATATATFTMPGDYILRLQANDSSGEGGGGFQCCWTNAHVSVSVK